jgi:hypothetical protein
VLDGFDYAIDSDSESEFSTGHGIIRHRATDYFYNVPDDAVFDADSENTSESETEFME